MGGHLGSCSVKYYSTFLNGCIVHVERWEIDPMLAASFWQVLEVRDKEGVS